MSDPTTSTPPGPAGAAPAAACAQCGRSLAPDEGVVAQGRRFCQGCFEQLASVVRGAVQAQSADVSYPLALAGAAAGGFVGALAWYLFVVFTRWYLGVVAIVIGIAGKGISLATGNKRTEGLQYLSAGVSAVAFVVATCIVNVHFLGPDGMLDFGFMDLLFGAITVYEGWTAVRPLQLA